MNTGMRPRTSFLYHLHYEFKDCDMRQGAQYIVEACGTDAVGRLNGGRGGGLQKFNMLILIHPLSRWMMKLFLERLSIAFHTVVSYIFLLIFNK